MPPLPILNIYVIISFSIDQGGIDTNDITLKLGEEKYVGITKRTAQGANIEFGNFFLDVDFHNRHRDEEALHLNNGLYEALKGIVPEGSYLLGEIEIDSNRIYFCIDRTRCHHGLNQKVYPIWINVTPYRFDGKALFDITVSPADEYGNHPERQSTLYLSDEALPMFFR